MQSKYSRQIALGGLLAAVAVTIMCLGGMIPIATYICPMLCTMTQFVVFCYCGKRISWAWYAVVCLLSLLLCPDKEAALVFLAIGYYPLIKNCLDKSKISFILKLLYFNISIVIIYAIMINFLGMRELVEESIELGMIGLIVILLLGNVTFILLDKLLVIMSGKMR